MHAAALVASVFHRLPTFDARGALQVVVECPKGSQVKIAWDPEAGAFAARRTLPVGVMYPYDWGFVPGTVGDDGDPLDAMLLHGTGVYPGVVVRAIPLGMLVVQQDGRGTRIRNNRIIALPLWDDRLTPGSRVRDLSRRTRMEIEAFVLNTAFFAHKRAKVMGWKNRRETLTFVRRSQKDFERVSYC